MKHLKNTDIELYDLISSENFRQNRQINLIASENYTSESVMEALGSCLTNKYSEGNIGKRYYAGNEFIDKIEQLTINRALELYKLKDSEWHVNVQPYSGSPANFAVYNALLNPHDRIMGMDLPSGGHLTHGFSTLKKKISATSIYFESMSYSIDPQTHLIDYNKLKENALLFKPKLIICGASSYPRDYDYKQFREICDSVGAYMMCDMSHCSGLIASGLLNNPFDYADIVTTTTHKTLRGPRSAMIFCKKSLSQKIDFSVFPSLQGGPHNNNIAAVCTTLKEANTDEFRNYCKQVISNAKVFADELIRLGYKLITNGTDNHTVLIDLRDKNVDGNEIQNLLERNDIITNKNSVIGDKSAVKPGGLRLGTSYMTTLGCNNDYFKNLANLINNIISVYNQNKLKK